MAYTKSPVRYLAILAIGTTTILALGAGFNGAVNPYDVFDTARLPGFNQLKPAADTRERISKPYRVLDARPNTIILGNSRPAMGLDPASECWPGAMQPIYNFAMLGAGLYDSYRYMQHAAADRHPGHVVLGLDFLFFLTNDETLDPLRWAPPVRDLEDLKVFSDGTRNEMFQWNRLKNSLKALFSMQSIIDSTRTVLSQGNPNAATINPDGHHPGRQFLDMIAREGQEVLFQHKNHEVADLVVQDRRLFQGGRRWSEPLETLRLILDFASRNSIRVSLFINPRHADFLNLLALTEKWSMMEAWKEIITELADRHGADLWDFHAYDERSTAMVSTDGQVMWGFWEPGHYRSQLGDLMIGRMFESRGSSCSEQAVSVGTRLRPDNVASHLDAVRRQQRDYALKHPEQMMLLQQLLDRAKQQRTFRGLGQTSTSTTGG